MMHSIQCNNNNDDNHDHNNNNNNNNNNNSFASLVFNIYFAIFFGFICLFQRRMSTNACIIYFFITS